MPDLCRAPTAAEVLRVWAVARGWTAASALPDEARAGRAIMKDYVAGRLLSCQLPPHSPSALADLAVSAAPGPRVSQAVAGSQALSHGSNLLTSQAAHSSAYNGDHDDSNNLEDDDNEEDEEDDDDDDDEEYNEEAEESGHDGEVGSDGDDRINQSSEAHPATTQATVAEGSKPTLVGATLDPTAQAAGSSHQVSASVAGTASTALAGKLEDASRPPRGTLPETSSAGVPHPDEPVARLASAHGAAGPKGIQGHDSRKQEEMHGASAGHAGSPTEPAADMTSAGSTLRQADVPAAAVPVVGSKDDSEDDDDDDDAEVAVFSFSYLTAVCHGHQVEFAHARAQLSAYHLHCLCHEHSTEAFTSHCLR